MNLGELEAKKEAQYTSCAEYYIPGCRMMKLTLAAPAQWFSKVQRFLGTLGAFQEPIGLKLLLASPLTPLVFYFETRSY